MDAVVDGALEEICSQGVNGLNLRDLWSKIHSHLSSNGLPLCPNVKKAVWSNLLNIPSLRFECKGVSYDAEDPKIQSFEDSEGMDLKIVAAEHMLNSFIGIYDITASDAGISQIQRRVLDRLAIARTDGVTQNDIAKEFDIKSNNIFYILRSLESRGLIVRQSTIIRKKEVGNEGEYKNGSIVNTNMLYLYRYARHLGCLQRLEITKEDKASTNNDNIDGEVGTRDGVPEEGVKEDVHIKDYVPALRAICDMLEKADGKVLVISDIKKELGYCKTSGHRAWRNILHRLKDAHLVEECYATVNKKKVRCLRLLKKFSPKTCAPKSRGCGDDDLDTEQQVKPVKRGQITEQLMELPIEQQIYDMIDAEGSKGLTLNEVYKRLGINNKPYYLRIIDMVSRFRMHIDSESLNRGVVYRVWTSGNFNAEVSNTLRGKLEDTMDGKFPTLAQVGQLQLAHTIQDSDHLTSKVDGEASEEQDFSSTASGLADASPTVGCNDTLLDSRSSNNLQCDAKGIIFEAELQMANVKPAEKVVSLDIPSSASPAPRSRRSYIVYPCLGLNSASSQREQRILEKLQEEKVLIKPELPRLLASLENIEKKHTVMDKKTLERSLNKLQEEGHCKCISFGIPAVTNCGRKRTIDVVLHPSVYNAEDLLDRVQERLRSFEKQIRTQVVSRHKSGKSIPVLNDVERICTTKYVPTETFEAMRNNGFVLAKMVRAKLLHIFLWGYLIRLSGWDDAISGRYGYEQKNPYSTCKLFELDAAIKAMPLELFLQVVGSSVKLEGVIEKCKNGLCLSDLPIQEYKCLMETRATARLSALIGILRRLKLIRLIGGELLDAPMGPHATLRHSLELKPYIEEPVGMVLPSTSVNSFDLRPHIRHDFVLASRKGVDEYWNTLEYCYAASDPKTALHAFPGSVVHEVFLARSWASVRVMTADQRAKLLKLVANEDTDQKISYKKCEKIAENLNLTLEQVLRVFYDKRQKDKLRGAANAPSLSDKRKRSLKGKPVNNGMEDLVDEELGKRKHAKMFRAEDATEERISLQRSLEDQETDMLIDELDGQKEAVDDLEVNADEDGHSYSNIHKRVLSKLPPRQKRFAWTENTDRQLVIEYVRNRAALGAKYHCTDWVSLQSLPAPPHTCRRRMSTLNRNNQFRKAVMGLCNMLSARYAKHLENSKNKPLGDHTNDFNIEERWDDFDNKDIKMVLDEVLSYKQTAKSEAKKGARYISKYTQTDVGAGGHEFDETALGSSAAPSNELKGGGRRQASARRSKCDLPKSYTMLMNGGKGFDTHAFKSLAVSNAIELLKLVYLSTAKAPEVPNLLAETLRRYSEHDMLTAFNFLRERNFMVMGNGVNDFVLSRKFSHNRSSSPFPPNTGERAVEMGKWLHERENDLLDNGVDLYADLQCGDVLQLCVLMCLGEVSMFPHLPDEGVGGIEDSKKRNSDDNEMCDVDNAKKPKLLDSEVFSRKEKGFPGIQLSLSRSMISTVDAITLSSSSNLEHNSSPSKGTPYAFSMTNVASESTWETMTCYAKHVASSEVSPFLFQTVYSAIRKAGDQGLSMEGISNMIDDVQQGEKIAELIVEVLEAFGRALKVNGYDSVHVVDSLYRSKYLLASMASLDLKVPETCSNDGEPSKLVPENHEKSLMKETCTEVHTSTDKMHRVTILNHPEEVPQPRMDRVCGISIGDSPCYKPILPWVNGDGTVNENVYKGLVRRVLGIVMQNPGILEEHVLSQMNVLNPQSCRKLLELMILDNHITVRKMYESISNEPPAMLHRLLGCNFKKPKLVCRQHLFANPRSITCL